MIKPIGERVLIKRKEQQEKTAGGIYIPDSAKQEQKEGTVVAVGQRDDGSELPLKKGDKVLYGGYSAEEFNLDGHPHVFVKFEDVLAKIE